MSVKGMSVKGMREVPTGRFVMGADNTYPEERPAHEEQVAGFLMDEHPVTNAEFRRFVAATGHVTTAEQAPDERDFVGAQADLLVPGSLVFEGTRGPVPLDDWQRWWAWVPGADWRHPTGPESTLSGLERHPVVHVSWEDALSYADWAGKALPTEVEWEYAARAGGGPTLYSWGEEFMPRGRRMAKTWNGDFPWRNDDVRHPRTMPIASYPPNTWGIVDLIGNVWEWTASPWTVDHSAGSVPSPEPPVPPVASSCCPSPEPGELAEDDRRVMKGGSHLCAASYCHRYRPGARQGQQVRSSTSHIGFRCVVRA